MFIPDVKVDKELKRKSALLTFTMEEIREALAKNNGNLHYAAKELGTTRPLLARKVKNTPSLQKFIEDLTEEVLDITEAELVKQIQLGNVTAISLMLRTKGRGRGYSERSTIDHELGPETMKSSAALIEAMRRGAEESKTIDVEEYTWVESEQQKQLSDQTS